MNRVLAAALLVLASVSGVLEAGARAADVNSDFLENDKEGQSRLYSESAVYKAADLQPRISASIAYRFRETLLVEGGACESVALAALQRVLREGQLPHSTIAEAGAALIVMRELGTIDDLVLAPLLTSLHVWKENPAARKNAAELKTDSPFAAPELAAMFKDDRNGCETDSYLKAFAWLKGHEKSSFSRGHVKDAIRAAFTQGLLTELRTKWLIGLYNAKFERDPFTLTEALANEHIAKNAALAPGATSEASDFAAGKKEDGHGLSRRLYLYHSYTGVQILLMSDRFQKFKDRVGAAKAEILITYRNGTVETRLLTPMEQYRMAAKMLHEEIEELGQLSTFFGREIPFEDIILAALETGAVASHELDSVLKVDDVWDPKIGRFEKVTAVLRTVVGSALLIVPPPYNIISALVVTLADALIKKERPRSATDRGISIF